MKTEVIVGLLLGLALAVGSLMPGSPMPEVAQGDKLMHLLGYGVLAAWWAGCFPARYGRTLLACSTYGVLIECLQAMTPYRSFDPLDMLANALGALLGVSIALAVRRMLPRLS
ncbi:VanZ family protein [Chitinimonas viridis]|uniref:VanZ family protein n=1 Tax=Chitinimonas viridis TaxID=664880 RepID=A0ABT8B5G8_9NEIS|nr:VanZ family protein [Chitinimonas viridis]MDN3576886.1 VanZ family protein [Chitinimonas viridis]